jgi:hypothetical protein
MKSQNLTTNTQNAPSAIFQSDVLEEKGQNGPTLAEIRERAFEIHIERGGIHGCDLTIGGRRSVSSKRSTTRLAMEGRKRNEQHVNTPVVAIAKTPSNHTS